MTGQKIGREPLIRIVKRDSMVRWQAWLIRIAAVVIALLISAIVSAWLTDGASMGYFSADYLMACSGQRAV